MTFYLKKNGAVWPGLAAATVKMSMKAKGGAVKINLGTVNIEDAATGKVSYSNAGTDFDTVDSYDAQFFVTIATKVDPSDIFEIEVRAIVA